MHSSVETVCLVLFICLMAGPGLYGLHLYILMFLARRRRAAVGAEQAARIEQFGSTARPDDWPRVTTQIPIYNELRVARRVIDAVARLDYPRDRHEIQVLDDSTDGTRAVVDQACAYWRARGVDIRVLRRPNREHYKAGALAHGLHAASGTYVAVFDADFVPEPGFLRRMLPLIVDQDDVACVQGRWGHLNINESWITQSLSLGLDGHFGVEQGARGWNGLLLNFNGTGGIWRRSAIDAPDVGGWTGDTITEDLDLSYRAQLAGWRIVYNAAEVVPAEIPASVPALKAQQRRWATGSIQTAVKLLPSIWRSRLTLLQKLEGSIHLTQYALNVFVLLMGVAGRPLLWLVPEERYQDWLESSWLIVTLAAAAPSIAFIYARCSLGGRVPGLLSILRLIVLGLGLSLNNTVAVLRGLVTRGGEFVRTPKSGSTDQPRALPRPYRRILGADPWVFEIILGAFCFAQWLLFLDEDRYVGGTFLLLYAIGLFALGWPSRSIVRPRSVPRPDAVGAKDTSLDPNLLGAVESSTR